MPFPPPFHPDYRSPLPLRRLPHLLQPPALLRRRRAPSQRPGAAAGSGGSGSGSGQRRVRWRPVPGLPRLPPQHAVGAEQESERGSRRGGRGGGASAVPLPGGVRPLSGPGRPRCLGVARSPRVRPRHGARARHEPQPGPGPRAGDEEDQVLRPPLPLRLLFSSPKEERQLRD